MRTLRNIIMALAVLLPAAGAEARTAADFFTSAPSSVMPLLKPATRLDMLDYFNHGVDTRSKNSFDGPARVVLNDPSKLVIELGQISTVQLGLLEQKGDTVVVVIETVRTPIADSSIRLYGKDWKPLAGTGAVAMPVAADFIPKKDRRRADAADLPALMFVRADFDPAARTFTMYNNVAEYYTADERPAALDLMRPSMQMRYDGKGALREVK